LETATSAPAHPLDARAILTFFLPLALSWVFMAVEGPIAMAVVSRMADPEVGAAAFLVMMSLAIWIESPVIDLLSTSTTLSRDAASLARIRRFTLSLCAWVTVAHFLAVFTPLYGILVERILGVPKEVADAARPGLMVMLPWSALIGWRRYHQGILIRNGATKTVGAGTTVRAAVMAISAFLMFRFSGLPSASAVAWALVASVAAEAAFIHGASRDLVRQIQRADPIDEDLSTRRLLRFHLPLTATTMVTLLGTPVVTAALARTPNPVVILAAFQVASTVLFVFRTATFALPEVVITLYKDRQSRAALKRFCVTMGIVLSVALVLFAVSPLSGWVFERLLGASPQLARLASEALLWGALFPFLGALQGYVRGLLTSLRRTASRMAAIVAGMATLGAMLFAGLVLGWPGIALAGISYSVAMAVELAALVWFLRR
jgi:Na+-driven multidrug efflux pump